MYGFLFTLRAKSAHGGPFEYRSGETDVLGWVCQAAAGQPMPELMSQVLWSRLGARNDAFIGIDSVGNGMFDGGICATLGDLARLGTMIARGGTSLTGEQVVGESWVADTVQGDPDSRAAFAAIPTQTLMPGGMDRNQLWSPYPDREVLLCQGIHGQMIYIDRVSGVVAVKLSSWPQPQDSRKLLSTLAAFSAVATALGE